MDKKIGLIGILILVGLILFVSAQSWAGEVGPIYLEEGWNLVYGFQTIDQLDGQALEDSHIKAIYAFIPTTQEYLRAWPDPDSSEWQNLDQVYDDHALLQTAYWVYSDKSGQTEYWLYDIPKPIEERPLFEGWNFVGLTQDIVEEYGQPDEPTLLDIQGNCDIEKAYLWLGGEWFDFDEIGRDVAELESNLLYKGMVVKVSDDCTLNAAYSEEVTPPPVPGENTGLRKDIENALYDEYLFEACEEGRYTERYDAYSECSAAQRCAGKAFADIVPEADLEEIWDLMEQGIKAEHGSVVYLDDHPDLWDELNDRLDLCL